MRKWLLRCIQEKRPKKAGRGKRGPPWCKLGVDASQWTLGSPGLNRGNVYDADVVTGESGE